MILHLPLVPDSQASVVVEPGVAPFDNPAAGRVFAGPLFLANAANMRDVPHVSNSLDAVAECLVEAEVLNGVRAGNDDVGDRRFKGLAVVPASLHLENAQRVPKLVSQHAFLDAALASVGRVTTDALPGLVGLGETAVHRLPFPRDLAAIVGELRDGGPRLAEYAVRRPTLHPAVARGLAGELRRQVLPLTPGTHAVQDGVEHKTQVRTRPASARLWGTRLKYMTYQLPETIRQTLDGRQRTVTPTPSLRRRDLNPAKGQCFGGRCGVSRWLPPAVIGAITAGNANNLRST